MLKVGVLASGRGSNLEALIGKAIGYRVVVAVSDRPGAYALERAKHHGIAAVCVDPGSFADKDGYESAIVNVLENHGVDLVCLAGYMRLVGDKMLKAYPDRIMNIHPALLPSFPGLHGQRQALAYGVKFSGCTVHFVDGGMDTGPVILQAVVQVQDDDSEDTLSARILAEEHNIYPEAVKLFALGRLARAGRRVKILTG